jgi:nucleoside-diphosphate-sugar epimerase
LIHCAAKAGDQGKYREFYDTNVIGTRHVIEACKRNGIKKIIFVSTPSIYFNGKDRYNISESEPLPQKQFNYGKTKLITESEILALAKEGFRTIILRPRAVYGKYDRIIVPRILQLSEKKNLPLINGGKALVDITYVDNFVSAVRNCFSAPDDAWNTVYNISNGDPIRIKDWFFQILEIFDRPFKPKNIPEPVAKTIAVIMELMSLFPFGNKVPALTRFSVGYMAKSMTMSIEKAKQKLKYSPKISNKEGFESYWKWHKQNR